MQLSWYARPSRLNTFCKVICLQYKIDFRHVYPDKETLLVSKWDDYMKKVTPQFDKKLHHDDIKKLYKYCKMGMASKGM